MLALREPTGIMTTAHHRRVFCIVLDSLGVGAMPDAGEYGDAGAHTLGHIAEAVGGLDLPNLAAMGLGRIAAVPGIPAVAEPSGAWGRMAERSPAKDTTSGHWEMMGQPLSEPFGLFPDGFPEEILEPFRRRAAVGGVLGNEVASGTEIIARLGEEHCRCGWPIVYTSADSVFQIAAHEEVVPLDELYRWCREARAILDPYRVGRVIARPFIGPAGQYQRTYERRDFSMRPPSPTWLELIAQSGLAVVGVGKIEDIFAGVGLTHSIHTAGNRDGMAALVGLCEEVQGGLIFANLIDFDMLYGHRRDPLGYARALREFDLDLEVLQGCLGVDDLLLLCADHGNDPQHSGTDHTREYAPLLAWDRAGGVRGDLGLRDTFADVGASAADALGVAGEIAGTSIFAPGAAR